MCCWTGITCCYGSNCGYCSECVGSATCNTELCTSCITGAVCCDFAPVCTPTPGSGTDICTNTSTSCCVVDVSACLPLAGYDENGNDIYQNQDGSLVYTDGSPATRADIAYNCGACKGTPCSPHTCGATDPPPHAYSGGGSSGGGTAAKPGASSGAGTAKPSGGNIPLPSRGNCAAQNKLTQAMTRLGSTITSFLSGGNRTAARNIIPGQKATGTNAALTPNSYLLVILIVGGLLLFLAFGHKPTPD